VLENGVLRVTEFSQDTDSYRYSAKCGAREELGSKTETKGFEKVRDRELYIKMKQAQIILTYPLTVHPLRPAARTR